MDVRDVFRHSCAITTQLPGNSRHFFLSKIKGTAYGTGGKAHKTEGVSKKFRIKLSKTSTFYAIETDTSELCEVGR